MFDMYENMRPLYDRVLIKISPKEDKTRGGIFIPDEVEQNYVKGTVISVGNGALTKNNLFTGTCLRRRDIVIFPKFTGISIGDDYIVLKEEEILGIVGYEEKS